MLGLVLEIEQRTLLQMATQWDRLAQHKAKIEARQGGQNSGSGLL
jgi:hypothetical protein